MRAYDYDSKQVEKALRRARIKLARELREPLEVDEDVELLVTARPHESPHDV